MTARFLLRYDTFSIAIPMCFDDVAAMCFASLGLRGERRGSCNIALTPKSGNRISALGLGCMRFPGAPGHPDAKTADAIISRVRWSRGINYLDTAYLYPGNEAWVRRLSAWACATRFCSQPSCRMLRANARRISTGSSTSNCAAYGLTISIITSCTTLPRPPSGNVWVALGIEDWIARQKAAGRIRQIGFSYHAAAQRTS